MYSDETVWVKKVYLCVQGKEIIKIKYNDIKKND